jgi:hypothetical protein
MAFNVPNAIAYGDTIASLEQAEPDSLDFQLLGDQRNVVINGGDATVAIASGSYLSVALTAAEVVIGANYGTVDATVVGSPLLVDSPTAGQSRFDLVCAKYDSGLSFVIIKGQDSATNPVYPAVPANHLPLHAIFVKTGLNTGVLARLIVDKRTFVGPAVYKTGSADPSGGQSGDLYFKTGTPASGRSSLWLNKGGVWENLGGVTAQATASTPNTLILRDGSGNFSAGTITANLTGNASTATNVPWTGVTGKPEVGNVFIRTTDPTSGDGVNGDVWIKVTA